MHIIVKNWSHYNSALGTYVKSKDHYDTLMKKGNYISYEECADRNKNKAMKEYIPSSKAKEILKSARNNVDKKGKVHLSGRTIEAMKEIGAFQKIPKYMNPPKEYAQGFSI